MESIEEIHDRLDKTMQEIISCCDAENVKSILIVTHAATLVAGVRAVLKDRSITVNCELCSLTKLVRQNGKWRLEFNGDCSFLDNGKERSWVFPSSLNRNTFIVTVPR